jgi:hypothetical protein
VKGTGQQVSIGVKKIINDPFEIANIFVKPTVVNDGFESPGLIIDKEELRDSFGISPWVRIFKFLEDALTKLCCSYLLRRDEGTFFVHRVKPYQVCLKMGEKSLPANARHTLTSFSLNLTWRNPGDSRCRKGSRNTRLTSR